MEISQFRGLISMFLSNPAGKANLNIIKMVRPEFAFELRNAIHKVTKTKKQQKNRALIGLVKKTIK